MWSRITNCIEQWCLSFFVGSFFNWSIINTRCYISVRCASHISVRWASYISVGAQVTSVSGARVTSVSGGRVTSVSVHNIVIEQVSTWLHAHPCKWGCHTLLTIFSMLYFSSLGLTYFMTGCLYITLYLLCIISPPPSPSTTSWFSVFKNLFFFICSFVLFLILHI